jgi:cytidylate kinase
VVCRELINQAARRAGAPEMALAAIDDLGLLDLRPSHRARKAYQAAVRSVMIELAGEGQVIIIGRAGQVILGDWPDVLHIKVMAPIELRAERVAHTQKISMDAARLQVETSDASRRSYLRRYYHVRWDNPELYDLIVNTARLEPDQAACLVCQAMEHCQRKMLHAAGHPNTATPATKTN